MEVSSNDGEDAEGHCKTSLRVGVTQVRSRSTDLDCLDVDLCSAPLAL